MMSAKSFLDASVKNVIRTLFEAILLVIIVVYVFLQSVRSTFIPLVGIVVSLVVRLLSSMWRDSASIC